MQGRAAMQRGASDVPRASAFAAYLDGFTSVPIGGHHQAVQTSGCSGHSGTQQLPFVLRRKGEGFTIPTCHNACN